VNSILTSTMLKTSLAKYISSYYIREIDDSILKDAKNMYALNMLSTFCTHGYLDSAPLSNEFKKELENGEFFQRLHAIRSKLQPPYRHLYRGSEYPTLIDTQIDAEYVISMTTKNINIQVIQDRELQYTETYSMDSNKKDTFDSVIDIVEETKDDNMIALFHRDHIILFSDNYSIMYHNLTIIPEAANLMPILTTLRNGKESIFIVLKFCKLLFDK
jgi:hypothetical protein